MSDTGLRPALRRAAEAAEFAPSFYNTQPWRWAVLPDRLELYAVPDRQLPVQDAAGHMLLISCGAALHHARVALEADGWRHEVDRPAGTPLAVLRPTERVTAEPAATRLFATLPERHTDRRTVTAPVPADVLQELVAAAEQAGARLHLLGRDQVIELAVAVEHAAKAEARDERLQTEMAAWVGGDRPGGTGIPGSAIPQELPQTTVAERDFAVAGTLAAGTGHDEAATYAVLYGSGDEPADWLRAGEALSAVWLTATGHGAGVLPLSSPVEVPATRHEVRRLLGDLGEPFLALRMGISEPADTAPARTPRLPTTQVIEIID
jgi:nitroreductase